MKASKVLLVVICIVLILFSDKAIHYFFNQTHYKTEQDNTTDYSEDEEISNKILGIGQMFLEPFVDKNMTVVEEPVINHDTEIIADIDNAEKVADESLGNKHSKENKWNPKPDHVSEGSKPTDRNNTTNKDSNKDSNKDEIPESKSENEKQEKLSEVKEEETLVHKEIIPNQGEEPLDTEKGWLPDTTEQLAMDTSSVPVIFRVDVEQHMNQENTNPAEQAIIGLKEQPIPAATSAPVVQPTKGGTLTPTINPTQITTPTPTKTVPKTPVPTALTPTQIPSPTQIVVNADTTQNQRKIIVFEQVGGKPNNKQFDNSPILQKVLSEAGANSVIIFGQGVYEFKTPVVIENMSPGVTISGLGVGRGWNDGSQLRWSGTGTFLTFRNVITGLSFRNFLVSCYNNSFLSFEGKLTNSYLEDLFITDAMIGIVISSYEAVVLNNVSTISEQSYSKYSLVINAPEGSGSNNLTIVKCSFDGCDTANSDVILINGGSGISFIHVDICNWLSGRGLFIQQKEGSQAIDNLVMTGINVARCDGGIEVTNMRSGCSIYGDNVSLIFRGKSSNEKGFVFRNNQRIHATLLGVQTRKLDSMAPWSIIESQDHSLSNDSFIEVSQNLSGGNAYITNMDDSFHFINRSFNMYPEIKFEANGTDKVYKLLVDSCSSLIGNPGCSVKIGQGYKCEARLINTFCGELYLELVFDKAPKGKINAYVTIPAEKIDYRGIQKNIDVSYPVTDQYDLYNELRPYGVKGIYTIEEFGGKSNDPSVDNSQAIKKAFKHMETKTGVLLFGSGTYYCSTPITMENSVSSIQMLGQKDSTYLEWTGSGNLFTFNAPIWWCRIDGFRVRCNNNSFLGTNDILFKSYISNIHISGCKTGLSIAAFAYGIIDDVTIVSYPGSNSALLSVGENYSKTREYLYMDNCLLDGQGNSDRKAVLVKSGSHIFLSNTVIKDFSQAIYIDREANAPMLSLVFFDNVLFNGCKDCITSCAADYIGQTLVNHCCAVNNQGDGRILYTKSINRKSIALNVKSSFMDLDNYSSMCEFEDASLHPYTFIQK